MDGMLNVLKPPGMTSFDVVSYLRRMLGVKKAGHGGTLDPMAVGVLPICMGTATKALGYMADKRKQYRAELTLGVTTDTQDSTGKVLSTAIPSCSERNILETISSFTGKYLQRPPMYSALKVNGKKLYELARKGIDIERPSREVEIFETRVLSIKWCDGVKVLFDIHCSKGTYIRTLCSDIGEKLGCGGHMSFLLRSGVGSFHIEEAYTLEELTAMQKSGSIGDVLIGTDRIFAGKPYCMLSENNEKTFRNGMSIPAPLIFPPGRDMGISVCGEPRSMCNISDSEITGDSKITGDSEITSDGEIIGTGEVTDDLVRVYDAAGKFIALAAVRKEPGGMQIKVKKFF